MSGSEAVDIAGEALPLFLVNLDMMIQFFSGGLRTLTEPLEIFPLTSALGRFCSLKKKR